MRDFIVYEKGKAEQSKMKNPRGLLKNEGEGSKNPAMEILSPSPKTHQHAYECLRSTQQSTQNLLFDFRFDEMLILKNEDEGRRALKKGRKKGDTMEESSNNMRYIEIYYETAHNHRHTRGKVTKGAVSTYRIECIRC